MGKKIKILIIPAVFSFFIPLITSASVFWDWSQSIVPCGPGTAIPVCGLCNLFSLGQNLISFGFTLVVEVLAPVAIVIGGFYVLTAGDSPNRLEQGKKTIIYAIIGIIIALASFVIVNTFMWVLGATTIQGTYKNFNGWNWSQFSCPK